MTRGTGRSLSSARPGLPTRHWEQKPPMEGTGRPALSYRLEGRQTQVLPSPPPAGVPHPGNGPGAPPGTCLWGSCCRRPDPPPRAGSAVARGAQPVTDTSVTQGHVKPPRDNAPSFSEYIPVVYILVFTFKKAEVTRHRRRRKSQTGRGQTRRLPAVASLPLARAAGFA